MQNDCSVYIDPDEDEVFFGRVSEKEKTVCAKLDKHEGSDSKSYLKFCNILNDGTELSEDDAVFGNKLISVETKQLSPEHSGDVLIDHMLDSVKQHDKLSKSFFEDEVSSKIISKNSSVELEHNYSTPMKHKIDKSILTTPKSIVKADKDGGFLKVLSEIALVKAEVEGNKKSEKTEEDNKENVSSIPEIKITEATPEKVVAISPPKSVNSEWRRFRIIYNSPQNENNIDCSSKLHTDTDRFENEKNFKNKCLNEDVGKFSVNDMGKSIDLIDFKEIAEPGGVKESFSMEREATVQSENGTKNGEIGKSSQIVISEEPLFDTTAPPVSSGCISKEKTKTFPDVDVQSSLSAPEHFALPNGLRFSKDARKIIEVLKKSLSIDDTLNSTVPEINLEEEENSFLSPEAVTIFDDTIVPKENLEVQPPKSKTCQLSPKMTIDQKDKVQTKSKTTEKDSRKLTPVSTQSKPRSIKYFSERKFYNKNGSEIKNGSMKRLPFEENRSAAMEKFLGGEDEPKPVPSSRIPVFAMKTSKLPLTEKTARPLPVKITPSKSPFIKTPKNSKFKHIESPINAYINNKPTSLVRNIKPEVKKDSVTKVWKAQTEGDLNKIEEKIQKAQKCNGGAGVTLPFVEYKSTTPYKIEKRPESRLPRLAPTVMKLIGSHSPKVLKHEGRFYVNSPRKQCPTENGTLVADPKEVSVLVSQPVQKSNTIK